MYTGDNRLSLGTAWDISIGDCVDDDDNDEHVGAI